MNLLILGDGPEELSWAYALKANPEHRLLAACPGFKSMPGLSGGNDLDAALAIAGLEAVICGGDFTLRAEGLRRASSVGLKTIALHPPGPNADPYYQIALSRQETGAIVVPDLPARLHPAMDSLAKAIREASREARDAFPIRYEIVVNPNHADLIGHVLPRVLDPIRALIGEVQAVTATGVPPGPRPNGRLSIQLRGDNSLLAEIVIATGPNESASLRVPSPDGVTTFAHDLDFRGPARLIRPSPDGGTSVLDLEAWDPKTAILDVMDAAETDREPAPGLNDGTRAMEVAEAAARSLRKGRTIDLHYEEISELGTFKSVMTSIGCGLILLTMVLMFVAAASHGLGFEQGVYVAWIIPPLLVGFALFQLFRYGIKPPAPRSEPPRG